MKKALWTIAGLASTGAITEATRGAYHYDSNAAPAGGDVTPVKSPFNWDYGPNFDDSYHWGYDRHNEKKKSDLAHSDGRDATRHWTGSKRSIEAGDIVGLAFTTGGPAQLATSPLIGLPNFPKFPEIPGFPKLPELPKLPEGPKLPELPGLPGLPGGPGGSDPISQILDVFGDIVDSLTGLNPLGNTQLYCGYPGEVGTVDFNDNVTDLVSAGALRPCFASKITPKPIPAPTSIQSLLKGPPELGLNIIDSGWGLGCNYGCPNDPEDTKAIPIGAGRRVICAAEKDGQLIANCGRLAGPALQILSDLIGKLQPLIFSPEACESLFPDVTCGTPTVLCSHTDSIPAATALLSIYSRFSVEGGLVWGHTWGPSTDCSGQARCRDPNAFFCEEKKGRVRVSNGMVCSREIVAEPSNELQELFGPAPLGYAIVHPLSCGLGSIASLPVEVGCPGKVASGWNYFCTNGEWPEPEPGGPDGPGGPKPCTPGEEGTGCVQKSCETVSITDVDAAGDVTIRINSDVVQYNSHVSDISDWFGELTAGLPELPPELVKARTAIELEIAALLAQFPTPTLPPPPF